LFITLEGPEGSGKTTQMTPLAAALRAAGYDVLTLREPGGTSISEQVRAILMNLENTAMHARTEILLFLAARAQLVEEVIRPQLAAGKVVLCDRYIDSTLAYQGFGQGESLDTLRSLLDFATGGLRPDLTILLDIESRAGIQRKQTSGEWTRMDAFTRAYPQRVRQGSLALAAAEPQRWLKLDAARPADEVQAELQQVILERLRARA
jgi:dTMP kinase